MTTPQIAPVISSVPLIPGEIGENDCADDDINPLMSWLDGQHTGYLVTALGPTAYAALYLRALVGGVTDNTHFSQYGATQMAALVVQGIREQHLLLASYSR